MAKQSDLSILLEDTPVSYYWLGFLLADGNFGEENLIKIGLSTKDEEHLIKLQNFLKIETRMYSNDNRIISFKAMDTKVVSKICKKFDIKSRKTYDPPNEEYYINIQNDLLMSLIIGFIDGDGSIRPKHKGFGLVVKCHGSWLKMLDFFAKKIKSDTNARLNKQGYAYFSISHDGHLKELKRIAEKLKLPVLRRKWDVIDLNYVKRKNLADIKLKDFKSLYLKLMNIPEYRNEVNEFLKNNKYE